MFPETRQRSASAPANYISFDPRGSFLGIHPPEVIKDVLKDGSAQIFATVLSAKAERWKPRSQQPGQEVGGMNDEAITGVQPHTS